MKVLIYGINYKPELTGIGKYTGEMADWLAKKGVECRVITAPPYYPAWKIDKSFSNRYSYRKENKHLAVFRCPLWVPEKPTTITRLIHLFSFMFSSLPALVAQLKWKPDIVFCIAPSFFYAPQALCFARLTGAKSWLHFQDFEICAMFKTGMLSSLKKLNHLAHKLQQIFTRKFDQVSTISNTMCLSADKNQTHPSRVLLFPNWVDTDFISPRVDRNLLRKKWGISQETTLVLYSGNLGKKQGLEIIIETALLLKDNKEILFVIVGDGAHKHHLKDIARINHCNNILFKPLQPYALLPNLLRSADIHLIVQKKGSGDAFLPSKLTSILSSGGNFIVTAEQGSELYHIVHSNPGIGIAIAPEDPQAMADEIKKYLSKKTAGINNISRTYAENFLNEDAILNEFKTRLHLLLKKTKQR